MTSPFPLPDSEPRPSRRLRVALFCGGRGSATLSATLLEHAQIHLTILVNAYDDGLSTGRMRALLPGMLGPSDIRKNVSTAAPRGERCQRAMVSLMEYRFPVGSDRATAWQSLALFCGEAAPAAGEVLLRAWEELNTRQTQGIIACCRAFRAYEAEALAAGHPFDYGDASLGNIFFTGCYLAQGRDFNAATRALAALAECRADVLNITDGANLVLTALKENGHFLHDEASIVSPQEDAAIRELFLLPGYLAAEEEGQLAGLPGVTEKLAFLHQRARLPAPNPEALEALRQADLIIYGPGTQHSSLLPSYLTVGVGEAIRENRRAIKVLVTNILPDHDIRGLSAGDLLRAFLRDMGRYGQAAFALPELVTHLFVQRADLDNLNRPDRPDCLPGDLGGVDLAGVQVMAVDWEEDKGRHHGGQMVAALLRLAQNLTEERLRPYHHTVSIVVPMLNEEANVFRVLEGLARLDFHRHRVGKEIIVVDGGSGDASVARARACREARVFTLPPGERGRGAALRHGLAKARGDVVVFFPADGEYDPEDLPAVVAPIVDHSFQAVFGSRAITCGNLNQRIRGIYRNRPLIFLLSKYGGMLLSILSLLLYNRYISDPLTSVKAFDAGLLKGLNLLSAGVELEGEIVAKLGLRNVFILEAPVNFTPRSRAEGKKIRVSDGLRTLWTLLRYRLFPPTGSRSQE